MRQPRRSSARAAQTTGISPICLPIWKPRPPWYSAPIDTLRGTSRPSPPNRGKCSFPPAARAVLERLQAALSDYDVSAASAVPR